MFSDDQVVFRFRGLFGVNVDIGRSIILLAMLFVGFSFSGAQDFLWTLSVFAMLIVSIYLHELGHAWGCLVQGVPVKRIMIHGGGGYCERARSASLYEQELIVAMGPIINLGLWAVASLATGMMLEGIAQAATLPGYFPVIPYLSTFAMINLALAIFNLLPVQPLDGGKLLHLGLARVLPGRQSMRLSGFIGLVIALLWRPALLYFYLTTGWLLLFAPSIRAHWLQFRSR